MAITPNTTFTAGAILTAAQMNRLPWGITAFSQKTADQTGISTTADVTNLSVTWTAVSTRYYRITVYMASIRQRTSSGIALVLITDGSNNVKTQANLSLTTDQFAPAAVADIETGLSGSTTRKVRMSTTAGTVDVSAASSAQGWYIVVEDLGQA
jgi:hypothetical protein